MRKLIIILSSLALLLSLTGTAMAAGPRDKTADSVKAPKGDSFPGARAAKQNALKAKARDLVLTGKATATGKDKKVKLGKGVFVQLAFEGEDQIFTLLGEFGPNQNNTHAGHPPHNGTPGPVHNQIPQPDRNGVDNTTIWTADFNQAHYENMLFNKSYSPSMANWYLEQSSGRYSVDGYVGPWVQVPDNEAAYGSNYCGSIVCTRDVGRFLADQGVAWYNAMVASGKTAAQIDAMLAPFDVWDRYDFDHDGNFDEPDGYIDHYQSVHAGEGEETGGGAQGTDAIWSHRSYANGGAQGVGPVVDGVANPAAGVRLGNSSKWIGDYTIEPENGGVGVFSHEFGHDLGLPDEYDTSGNTGGAENGTGWWTIMSQGSYGTQNGVDLGSAPVHFNAWDKWQLGWLNHADADVSTTAAKKGKKGNTFNLGPAEYNSTAAQALILKLPDKKVTTEIGPPIAGTQYYFSGSGNDLDNTMTRPITLGAGPINLSFTGRWQIETCWDYAYLQVSTDGGATFTNVNTSASTTLDENGQNFGFGITGTSGQPHVCDTFGTPTAVNVTADLSAYANSTIQLRFRYWTDGAAVGDGFSVDDIAITGLPTDGAETDPGWAYDGFIRTTGTEVEFFPNYYIAEYRQYLGYDKALKLGPYNFTDPNGNWVEHFPYQDGLLVWYYDTSQHDNNVGDHPGAGLILPIDAHPAPLHWSDGSVARPRVQSYDATFGLQKTDKLLLHNPGKTLTVASQKAVSVFDDSKTYWVSGDPGDAASNGLYQSEWNSVNNPHTGTVLQIVNTSKHDQFMKVRLQ